MTWRIRKENIEKSKTKTYSGVKWEWYARVVSINEKFLPSQHLDVKHFKLSWRTTSHTLFVLQNGEVKFSNSFRDALDENLQ